MSEMVKHGIADLAMSEDEIRERVKAGDPAGLRALRAQVDDFVDNDPLLQDIQRQLLRGDGPGCLVFAGSATWAPVRGAGDFSAWGDWEVWEECAIGPMNNGTAVGAIPTGGWLSWHAPSGQTFGIPADKTNARLKAEMMSVVQNAGRRTRVVLANGDASASELDFAETAYKVGNELERLTK